MTPSSIVTTRAGRGFAVNARTIRLATAAALAFALPAAAIAAQGQSPWRIDVPPVPAGLEVPAGHELFLAGYAEGTQNYVCVPTSSGFAWRFIGPQATLFYTFMGTARQQVTTHFLSADPSATARPTWQHSLDSSRVWGRVRASSTDANYVEAGAVPWLLLEAAATASGPAGGSMLAPTTFIQRLNTSGGIAPSDGCTDSSQVALVPYTTEYFFYRASRAR